MAMPTMSIICVLSDEEISKIILNQTMTIDNGASLSQSQVHLEIFDNVCISDARRMAYIINDRLLPLMAESGFPVDGLTFAWDYTDDMRYAEIREQERVILQYYDVDPQYFVDRYGVPITGRREASNQPLQPIAEDQAQHSLQTDFFA